MATNPEPTEREIVQKMREYVNARKGAATAPSLPPGTGDPRQFAFIADKSVPGFYLGRLRNDVELLHLLQDAVGTINPRPEGLVNAAVQFIKRNMARALSWYTRPLHQFHGAVARAMEQQLHALESLQNQLSTLSSMHQQMASNLNRHASTLQDRVTRLNTEVEELRKLRLEERLRAHDITLRRLGSEVTVSSAPVLQSHPVSGEHTPSAAAISQTDFDYTLFQEYHRGSEKVIRDRQRNYVRHFSHQEPVWDLGCGRGEFLELLRDHGIPAEGVDNNSDAVSLCRHKGLNVTQSELFEFLESRQDQSAGGIFSAQVIEHLPAPLQLRLVDLCYRKLKPGAPLLLETINPECLFALARNFYLDPTHIRPVHAEFLRFVLERVGFKEIQLEYSSPVEAKYVAEPTWQTNGIGQALTDTLMNLNHFAFGCQDYAAIAWRPERS